MGFSTNSIGFLLAIAVLASSCSDSGGSGSGSEPKDLKEGVFIDSPVVGLEYSSPSSSGVTDSSGTFSYAPGEKIQFKINGVPIGKGLAEEIMTPYSLHGENDTPNQNRAINILRTLQTIDQSKDNSEVIELSNPDQSVPEVEELEWDQAPKAFEESPEVGNVLEMYGKDSSDLISVKTATDHFKDSVKDIAADIEIDESQYKGQDLVGTYGDFRVYELIQNIPSDLERRVLLDDLLSTLITDIMLHYTTNPFKIPPDYTDTAISLLQFSGALPAVMGIYLDGNGGYLGGAVRGNNDVIFPTAIIKTADNTKTTNPGSIVLKISGTTHWFYNSMYLPSRSATPDSSNGISKNKYSFVDADVSPSFGKVELESGLINALQPSSIYILVPSGQAISGLHDSPIPESGTLVKTHPIPTPEPSLNRSPTDTTGITLSGEGRYFFSLHVDQVLSKALVSSGGSASVDVDSQLPEVPQNISLTSDDSSISGSWDEVANADKYVVYWSKSPDVTVKSKRFEVENPEFTHDNLDPETSYFYRIQSVNGRNTGTMNSHASDLSDPYNHATGERGSRVSYNVNGSLPGGVTRVMYRYGENLDAVCASEFGTGSTVADWNHIKNEELLYSAVIRDLAKMQKFRLWVTKGGERSISASEGYVAEHFSQEEDSVEYYDTIDFMTGDVMNLRSSGGWNFVLCRG